MVKVIMFSPWAPRSPVVSDSDTQGLVSASQCMASSPTLAMVIDPEYRPVFRWTGSGVTDRVAGSGSTGGWGSSTSGVSPVWSRSAGSSTSGVSPVWSSRGGRPDVSPAWSRHRRLVEVELARAGHGGGRAAPAGLHGRATAGGRARRTGPGRPGPGRRPPGRHRLRRRSTGSRADGRAGGEAWTAGGRCGAGRWWCRCSWLAPSALSDRCQRFRAVSARQPCKNLPRLWPPSDY